MVEGQQPDERDEFIEGLQHDLKSAGDRGYQMSAALAGSAFGGPRDGNFLQYQLESIELLDKLENFYRGKYVGYDEEYNQIWKESDDDESRTLNDYGVNVMMETVTKYIDKNTVLSYYSEERIYEILADLGDDLVLVIYCNYERMGMNTYSKKTKFRILITTTLHMIESSYRRAISGRTMEETNQSRIVTQSDHLGHGAGVAQSKKKAFNLFNPSTWVN